MKPIYSIVVRYVLLLVLGVGGLVSIYAIVTPLTIYPVFAVLDAQYGASLLRSETTNACDIVSNRGLAVLEPLFCIRTTIFFNGYYASIIPACIAGSAYYLLLMLNLTTPMDRKKRLKSLSFLLVSFLLVNIIRIIVFANIYAVKGFDSFTVTHAATWYFGSTVFIIILWFAQVVIYKVRAIPVYSDVKTILSKIS